LGQRVPDGVEHRGSDDEGERLACHGGILRNSRSLQAENPSIDRGLQIKYSSRPMITVPSRRVKQFGVEFYQAGLSAKDIDRLVKFEVLGYSGGPQEAPKQSRSSARARVNWDMLEKRIAESETAYQRPVIRRKIDELVTYYKECKDAGTLPAIPVAHTQPRGPQALPGPEQGARPRRDPLAKRGRDLATPRRDQDARHRARARESGAARRGDRGLSRNRREARQRRQDPGDPPRREALLPELRQGALDHVPHRLGQPEVLDQDGRGPAGVYPRRARRHGAHARAQARPVRPQRDPGGDQALGRAAPRPAVRDRGRVEAEARRRHARHGRDPHARAAGSAPRVTR